MKKLALTLAIVVATVLVHAGSVTWSTVAMYDANESKVKGTATLYVYLLADADAYNGVTDVWSTYGDNVKDGGSAASNVGGTKSKSYTNAASVDLPKNTATANTAYYAAIIVTIGAGESLKYYAEKATVTTGDDGNYEYKVGLNALDSAEAAKVAWTSATAPITPDPGTGGGSSGVPEPTSGLLLVMGSALLVLRRKQK